MARPDEKQKKNTHTDTHTTFVGVCVCVYVYVPFHKAKLRELHTSARGYHLGGYVLFAFMSITVCFFVSLLYITDTVLLLS